MGLLRLPFALGRVAGRLRHCAPLHPGGDFLLEATLAPGRTTAVATLHKAMLLLCKHQDYPHDSLVVLAKTFQLAHCGGLQVTQQS